MLAVVAILLLILVSVWRWKIILDARDLQFSTTYLTKISIAAWFFNNLLPTSIGGDVVRVIYTIKDNKKALAFSAAFIDRMIGFIGLFLFALIASTLLLFQGRPTKFLMINLIGLILLLIIVAIMFNDKTHRIFAKIYRQVKIFRLDEKIDRIYAAVKEYRQEKRALIESLLLSLLLQANLALAWYLIGLSVGIKISALYYFLYIPIIGLLTMIPITIGGLGIRENSFVSLFTQAGTTQVQATATSLLYLAINYLYALAGGIVFLFLKRHKTDFNPPNGGLRQKDDDSH